MNYGFRFRDWNIYKDARAFRIEMMRVLRSFPKDEQYALIDQTKRALLSIVLNIAESANKSADKDTRVYINRAHCSLDEVIACFDCAMDSGYITNKQRDQILAKASGLAKQLNGFTNHLSKTNNSKLTVNSQQLKVSKGFTLVELLLYTALVGILLTAAAIFASDVVYSSVKGRARAKVQHEATLALEKMRQEIVKGNNINTPAQGFLGGTLKVLFPDDNGDGLFPWTSIQVNGSGSAPNMLQVCSKDASACFSTDSWQNLTSGEVEVTNLTFTNISSGTSLGEEAVKIQMTVKNKNPGGKKEFDAEVNLETSIALRL